MGRALVEGIRPVRVAPCVSPRPSWALVCFVTAVPCSLVSSISTPSPCCHILTLFAILSRLFPPHVHPQTAGGAVVTEVEVDRVLTAYRWGHVCRHPRVCAQV